MTSTIKFLNNTFEKNEASAIQKRQLCSWVQNPDSLNVPKLLLRLIEFDFQTPFSVTVCVISTLFCYLNLIFPTPVELLNKKEGNLLALVF